jgi:regulator of sigma E protease
MEVGFNLIAQHTHRVGGQLAINIGVFNLIPFPALDGGRFLLIIFEGLTGKKMPLRIEAAINNAGLALLLGLMVVVTISDISKFF